jgi:hypothetical protein
MVCAAGDSVVTREGTDAWGRGVILEGETRLITQAEAAERMAAQRRRGVRMTMGGIPAWASRWSEFVGWLRRRGYVG